MRFALLAAVPFLFSAFAADAKTYPSSAGPLTVDRIAGPIENPWGMSFLPGGDMVVTARPGQLYVASQSGDLQVISGLPKIWAYGQGGLLDVAVDPDFDSNNTIYLTFSEPANGGAHTALMSAVLDLDKNMLADKKMLFRQQPTLSGGRHFGSRIVFGADGTLFITTGDRGDADLAQELDNHVGKVIRINKDGSVPADNPFVGVAGALPEIWSIGHRNAQGAAITPDGAYHTISHGARGGDEVNQPEAGKNYGWPVISYGSYYSGIPFRRRTQDGMEQPLFYWDPSIAPSGAAFYSGDVFADWNGNLLVGALKYQLISRLEPTTDGGFREAERLFEDEFGRVRDVRVGPAGAIWFLTDEQDGGVYRITPAD